MEQYKSYVLLDYDIVKSKYLLEIYDFKDNYFNIKEFNFFDDLVNFYHEELGQILQIDEKDILTITSNSYQRKLGVNEYKKLEEEITIKRNDKL